MITGAMSRPPLHQLNYTKEQMEQRKISTESMETSTYEPETATGSEPKETLPEWIARRDEYFYNYCGNKPMSKSSTHPIGLLIYEPRRVPPGEEDTFQNYDKVE